MAVSTLAPPRRLPTPSQPGFVRPEGTEIEGPTGGYPVGDDGPAVPGPVTTAPQAPQVPQAPVEATPIPPQPAGGGGVPSGGGGGGNPGLDQTINDTILRILNQGDVSADDPLIRDVANARRHASGRAFDRQRAMLAERNAAQGLSGSGAADTGIMGLAQQRGESDAAFEANLLRDAQTERANQILAALQLGQGRISDQQRNALQSELAQLQAALSREGMSLQASQFEANNELDWLRLLLGGLS